MSEKTPIRTTRLQRKGLFSDLSQGMTVHELTKVARLHDYEPKKLAGHFKISIRHLERILQNELGRTPAEWINEIRLLDSRDMLIQTQSIKQVANLLGYKQESYFCRAFKRAHGITPSEFISMNRDTSNG